MKSVSKIALVTGASSGIGQATARLLAQKGYTVFGTSRKPEQAPTDAFTLLPLDVCSRESVQQCVQKVMAQAQRIDLLVNNAGYDQVGAIEENSVADAQAQFDTNVFGTLRMIKAVLPIMRQQGSGRIITVSSVLGLTAIPYTGLYAASKFALEGLSEALRSEVARFNIHVSLVEPVSFKTNLAGRPPARPIEAYRAAQQRVLGYFRQSVQNGPDPIIVARAIVKIAVSTHPRLHNIVGRRAKLLITLKALLPQWAFERVHRRVFHIPSPHDVPNRSGKNPNIGIH